jgi:26S proteasome regulatory subunit N10
LKGDDATYEELGGRMRRNNVAIDIINFAHPENVPKL